MMMLPKWIAISSHEKEKQYIKYGFVIIECVSYLCPRCGCILNAGPNYQPKYCDQCGQKVSFKKTKWKSERKIGFTKRRKENESVENRVV